MEYLFVTGLSLIFGFVIGCVAMSPGESKPKPKVTPVKTVTEAQLDEMFLNAPDNPLWQATLAVLDQSIANITERGMEAKQDPAESKFHLGGAAALLEFRAELEDREAQARKMREAKNDQ